MPITFLPGYGWLFGETALVDGRPLTPTAAHTKIDTMGALISVEELP